MHLDRLTFESPDLAGWLWIAAGGLIIAEILRHILISPSPGGRLRRALLCAVLLILVVAGGAWADLRPLRWHHAWGVGAVAALAVVWLIRSYRHTTRNLRLPVRRLLLAIRLAALAVLAVVLLRPVVESVEIIRRKASLGVMVDGSRSMAVEDVPRAAEDEASGFEPRADAVRAALERSEDGFRRLNDEIELRWFTFDREIQERSPASLKPDGEATALADAVADAHRLLGSGDDLRPAGVMVISDGRDTFSQRSIADAGKLLADAGAAIYAVGVGSESPVGQNRSLIARRLDCPPSVTVLNRMPVEAEFLAAGLAGGTVAVELLFDGQVVDRKEVQPSAPQELLRVGLGHTPTESGLHRVTVRAFSTALKGVQAPAELSQFVRVTDDQIQVLYLDRARHERAAIARALAPAADVRLHTLDLNVPAGDADTAAALKGLIQRLPAYHVIILGDLEPAMVPEVLQSAITDRVRQGGAGLVMLGGVRTLGTGKYRNSPLSEVLPAQLSAVGVWPAPVAFELTPAGRSHPICALLPDLAAGRELWMKLPPFDGAGNLGEIPPAAEVLIVSLTDHPLLTVQESGRGRAAVLSFDSTWRWSFHVEEGAEAARRFWRQLVLWLANRRPFVYVTVERPRYDLARPKAGDERIAARAGVVSVGEDKPSRVEFTGTLVGPGGATAKVAWVRQGEEFVAQLEAESAGEYHLQARASGDGEPLGDAEAAFMVEAIDSELTDPLADLDALRQMAGATALVGGRYVPLDKLNELLEQIRTAGHATEIRRYHRNRLVQDHAWGWLIVFVALLALEWISRRRAGLI